MKKFTSLALTAALALALPAFADSPQELKQDVQSDAGAIKKDNAALEKDQRKLTNDRAAKAMDQDNGNYGRQATDSAAIAADKTEIKEKRAEKYADQKIMKHHKKKLEETEGSAGTSSGSASSRD